MVPVGKKGEDLAPESLRAPTAFIPVQGDRNYWVGGKEQTYEPTHESIKRNIFQDSLVNLHHDHKKYPYRTIF